MSRLLLNRDFILLVGLFLGLFAGDLAQYSQSLTLPALAVVMTLSTLEVSAGHLKPVSVLVKAGLKGILFNYLILSGFFFFLSRLFSHDQALANGFLILAAAPPAVAVIPFTEFLDGDRTFSLLATTGAYLAGLLIMPLLALAFWGAEIFNLTSLVKIILLLIILPVAAAQLLRAAKLASKLKNIKGPITNWCFFIVVYSIVGLNRHFIVTDIAPVLPIMLAALFGTFGMGFLVGLWGKLVKLDHKRLVGLVLLGSLKNYGLAGGLALALFEQRAALPAVVSTSFMILYIIWLGLMKKWLAPARANNPESHQK
jgi:BASS family bile acid:Na+ symporter